MRIESVGVPGWPRPRGYSDGMLVSGPHRLLFVAGQIGWNEGRRIVSADFVAQFRRALENVVAIVRAAGGAPENIVRLTLWVTDKKAYRSREREVGEVYRDVMGRVFPAMALLEVADLLEDGALVEIEATAALSDGG